MQGPYDYRAIVIAWSQFLVVLIPGNDLHLSRMAFQSLVYRQIQSTVNSFTFLFVTCNKNVALKCQIGTK